MATADGRKTVRPRAGEAKRTFAGRIIHSTRGQDKVKAAILLLPSLGWLTLFLIAPLALVFIFGFATVDNRYHITFDPWTTQNYIEALSGDMLQIVGRTFGVAAMATVGSLLLGYAVAYFLARIVAEKWRGPLMALIVIPFWVSFVVRVFGVFPFIKRDQLFYNFLSSVGLQQLGDIVVGNFPQGSPELQIYLYGLVVMTLIYVWIPFMVLPLFTSLLRVDNQLLEAAYNLGASRLRAFRYITLPLTYPAIVTGCILVFITTLGSFVEPALVAGGSVYLVGNHITTQFASPTGMPKMASSSMFLIITTLILIVLYTRYAELGEPGAAVAGRGHRVMAYLRAKLEGWVRRGPRPRPAPEVGPAEAVLDPAKTLHRQNGGTLPTLQAGEFRVGPVPRTWMTRVIDAFVEKLGSPILMAVFVLTLLAFFVPLLFVVIFSFNSGVTFGEWTGFSLRWYLGPGPGEIWELSLVDPDIQTAVYNSIVVALSSAVLSLIVGTMAAFALIRYKFVGKESIKTVSYLGLVIPSLVLGISLLMLIRFLNDFLLEPAGLGWSRGLTAVIVGHTTFNIPLATLVMLISLREFDRSLEEAAMDLGADEMTTFFKVTLPLIMPGIISCLLLTFTFSFDELPVTYFLYGGKESQTLPIFIWGMLSRKITTPVVNAASTVILLMSIIFVLLANKVQRGGTIFRI